MTNHIFFASKKTNYQKSIQKNNEFNKFVKQMDTIFMNSENSKTFDTHRILLNLTDQTNLTRRDKYVASSNHSIYYIWKNIKKSQKNDEFKILAPTWNEEL